MERNLLWGSKRSGFKCELCSLPALGPRAGQPLPLCVLICYVGTVAGLASQARGWGGGIKGAKTPEDAQGGAWLSRGPAPSCPPPGSILPSVLYCLLRFPWGLLKAKSG